MDFLPFTVNCNLICCEENALGYLEERAVYKKKGLYRISFNCVQFHYNCQIAVGSHDRFGNGSGILSLKNRSDVLYNSEILLQITMI